MQFPTMSKLNKGIVIAFVSLFVLSAIASKTQTFSLANFLGLSLGGLMKGKVWTLFTYAFLPHGLLECLFDGLIFWFIGSELENMWGPRRYTYFLLTTIFGGALFYLILSAVFFSGAITSFPMTGPAGLASTMCVAYGVLFPDRTMYFFFFPMQAKWFVILLIAMNLYHGFFTPGGMFAWAQIGAMISGFIWMVSVSNKGLLSALIPARYRGDSSSGARPHARSRKRSSKISHLHIVEEPEEPRDSKDSDDDDTPPTYH